jgi:hypothetical protein
VAGKSKPTYFIKHTPQKSIAAAVSAAKAHVKTANAKAKK